jgi:hypothetical protein
VPSHKNVPEFSSFDEGQGPREGVERTDKTDNTSLTLTIGRQNPRNFGTFIPAPTDKTDETRASAKIYAFIPRRSDKTDETLRPALAPIIAAYGDVEILIRPATPAPLSPEALAKRRKWLTRPTALFGKVNAQLPREPLPPVVRLAVKHEPERSDRKPRFDPHACAHCVEHCSPSDMMNFQTSDGRWVHLGCDLKAGGRA